MDRAVRFGLSLAMIVLAGCSDASSPPHDIRRYALESIGGDTLPFLIDSSAAEFDVVVWDSLAIDFTSDTTFEVRMTKQHFPSSFVEDDESWNSDAVAMAGDSITLSRRGGAGYFTSPREGLVDTSFVSVRSHGPSTPNAEYVYRAVGAL